MPHVMKQKFIADWWLYRYNSALLIVSEWLKMDAETNICFTKKDFDEAWRCSIQRRYLNHENKECTYKIQ